MLRIKLNLAGDGFDPSIFQVMPDGLPLPQPATAGAFALLYNI